MSANNLVSNRQSKARALLLGRKERIEDSVDRIPVNAATMILYRNHDVRVTPLCGQFNLTSLRRCLDRVESQVENDLVELLRVALQSRAMEPLKVSVI